MRDRPSRGFPGWSWFCLSCLLVLGPAGCATAPADGEPVRITECFLGDTEELVYSEILQGRQRVAFSFELVDGVRPPHEGRLEGVTGHWIPAGPRRVQFRVVLLPAGWNNGGAREARGVADVMLEAGHRYRIAGDFRSGPRTFHVFDATTGRPVTTPIDLGFFAPVDRAKAFLPLIVLIKN